MNLDNYFARYLGKSSKSVPKADLGEVVNPTHLMSADHGAVASSVVQNVSPIDEEGAASQQADNYPTETTKTFTVLSNDGDEVRQLRMDPLMDVGRPPQRRRIEMSSEEDELDLLLGSTQATEVKQQKPQHGAASLPTSATTELPRLDGVSCTIASLNWSTRSSSMLDDLARLFQKQFEYQLQESDEVLAVFEPFFRDRQLARIAASGPTEPVFREEEPVIDATNIGSLSGCVLRDYQVEGVRFLHRNFVHGTSCILADDMGLGKTAQLASFLMVLKNVHGIEGPHLIVSPLSTLTSWTRELARWAPGLRVLKYYGERSSRKQSRHAKHNRHAVVVTTPAVLNQDRGFFRHRTWVTVLVDEAHVLKGNDTRITMTARKLKACMRIAITGTPVHNRVQEVWSLMSYLYPTLTAQFDRSYVEDAVGAAEDCARLLQRIMLRRTKESLELGIPPRVDEPLTLLEPTYVQQQLLTRLTSQALETHSSSGQLQGHLTHQRCVCNHPLSLRLLATDDRQGSITERLSASGIHLTEDEIIAPSAKMVHLDQLLKQLQVEGHRCLIFSNFTSTLDLLEGLCLLRGFRYERLDGTCNRVERELSMLRFNAPNSTCFIFLATTTAGGVGVTLTGADTVILFDAHFNPQLDRQAADRAHRLGQTREVRVFRLCLHNTIEEHIRDIAEKKASLGAFIVDGGRCQGTQLSADDIREILEQMEAHQEARRHLPVTEGALEEIVSASQAVLHAEDDALVERLVEVNVKGSGVKKGANERGRMEVGSNNNCFVCGGIMHAMEPLYRCVVCPKSYHAKCIGEKVLGEGKTPNRQWSCPRHVCTTCGKAQGVDGAIFLCVGCPRSYCFECLDPRYLQLHEDGSGFLHLTKTYSDMEHERMGERRSLYYMTCLYCCGILSSSESDGDEEEEESSDEENKSVESISD